MFDAASAEAAAADPDVCDVCDVCDGDAADVESDLLPGVSPTSPPPFVLAVDDDIPPTR